MMKLRPESTRENQNTDPPTILILGGSGGIGRAIAENCRRQAGRLILHGRDAQKLEQLRSNFQTDKTTMADIEILCADMDDSTALPVLLEATEHCDILVISRGAFAQKSLRETSNSDWQMLCYSNLSLPGMLATRAACAMAERTGGRILLFGGTRTETVRGYRHNAAYAAAKTGLAVITKSLAAEFASAGVAIAMICPGFVDTEYLTAAAKQKLIQLSPTGRLMTTTKVAQLAKFLLDGGIHTVNGAIINADEGLYSL